MKFIFFISDLFFVRVNTIYTTNSAQAERKRFSCILFNRIFAASFSSLSFELFFFCSHLSFFCCCLVVFLLLFHCTSCVFIRFYLFIHSHSNASMAFNIIPFFSFFLCRSRLYLTQTTDHFQLLKYQYRRIIKYHIHMYVQWNMHRHCKNSTN